MSTERIAAPAPGLVRLLRADPWQQLLFVLMFSIWGSSFFFTALALRSFNPLLLPLLRMSIATVVLAGLVAVQRRPLPRRRIVYLHVAVLGAVNIAIPYVFLTWAQTHVASSMAIVLSATTPIFVFLFSWLIVRTESFRPLRGLGLLLAFAGVAILAGLRGAGGGIWPMVIIACSMVFAAGNVYTRRFLAGVDPMMIAFLQIAAGTLGLFLIAAAGGALHWGAVQPISLAALLELGLLGSAFAYVLFFHFIQRWGSTAASLNTYLQPITGLALGVCVLGETMTLRTWVALAIILTGVLLFGIGSVLK
jgi:drug/metabolite transporter (DMT)-like permease